MRGRFATRRQRMTLRGALKPYSVAHATLWAAYAFCRHTRGGDFQKDPAWPLRPPHFLSRSPSSHAAASRLQVARVGRRPRTLICRLLVVGEHAEQIAHGQDVFLACLTSASTRTLADRVVLWSADGSEGSTAVDCLRDCAVGIFEIMRWLMARHVAP
jgi:hypothetical protein